MYVFKNALKNLARNKGRNILIAIIMFAIVLATSVSLIINTTSKSIIDDYKQRFGSKVIISVDMENLFGTGAGERFKRSSINEIVRITTEQYLDFADSDTLLSAKFNVNYNTSGVTIKAIDEDIQSTDAGFNRQNENFSNEANTIPRTLNLLGYSDSNEIAKLKSDTVALVEGSLFTNDNECIISIDLADFNNLKIGDEIEIYTNGDGSETILLKITGLYADTSDPYSDTPFQNANNQIITNFDTIADAVGTQNIRINAQYELKSPELLVLFEKEVREKGLPDSYIVDTDEAQYNSIVKPVVSMSGISTTFMWVVLILGAIILLFLTSIAVRERKYEIGVLRAMGMKKAKVGIMFISEMLAITLTCLILAIGVGSIMAQPVANVMLESQLQVISSSSAETQTGNFGGGMGGGRFGFNNTSTGEPLSEMNITLTTEAVVQIVFVALFIAMLSSSVGVIYITRYEPIKILSERN